MTRRVLQVIGAMERGGIQNILVHLARRLDPARYRLDFLLMSTHPGAHDDELRRLGCRLILCPGHRNPWRYARGFEAALGTHGPYDVVHAHVHHFNGVVMRLAARHGVPVRIAHSHDDQRGLPGSRRPDRRLYEALMRRWIARHATLKPAASTLAAEALFGPDWRCDPAVQVLPCGLDLGPFEVPPERDRLRRALGLPPEAPVIGHVGRFAEQKNQSFLLDIIAAACAREPRLHALLVGEGPTRPAIEAKACALGLAGRVIFAGGRDDVPALMLAAMDVFVFPSLHEGLGIALLEAQAAGLPCVLADHVPVEVDVIPDLLRRLPLATPAGHWADATLAALARRPVSRVEALMALRASPFDLAHSVRAFARLYDGEA